MNSEPIPAATLIIARDNPPGPPDLLMVERAGGMAFAAGAWVFPGGRIDDEDRVIAAQYACEPAAVAAIRETLEETAVPVGLAPLPSYSVARTMQRALVDGAGLGAVLPRHGIKIAPEALTPFARWVPKFHAVRRFDTLFFVARCPPGDWEPQIIEGECSSAAWLSAAEVLERDRNGAARLIFPTRRNLERLAQHRSFKEITDDAERHAIEPITPWVETHGNEQFITIPSDLGYPVTNERLEGLWRG